jgi:hypothetical protein
MSRTRSAALVAALAALALAAGCSKRITEVDASYTQVEGTPSASARLTVWNDTALPVQRWQDALPPGPSEDDDLLGTTQEFQYGEGTVVTQLIDRSSADGFEFLRRAANGGFEPLRDFTQTPVRKWLPTQTETYRIVDDAPSGYTPGSYIARGLLGGRVTAQSPLSNLGQVTLAQVPASITYTGALEPRDSLFTMSWTPVAGAAGYWVQVYQFRSDATIADRRLAGTPNPIVDRRVTDNFIGYLDASLTSYTLGDISTPGVEILEFRPPILGRIYEVRITAVDAEGEVIGYLPGNLFTVQLDEETYERFPSGAFQVNPKRPLSGAN